MVELVVILVFALMFFGPCAMATGIAKDDDEGGDKVA